MIFFTIPPKIKITFCFRLEKGFLRNEFFPPVVVQSKLLNEIKTMLAGVKSRNKTLLVVLWSIGEKLCHRNVVLGFLVTWVLIFLVYTKRYINI